MREGPLLRKVPLLEAGLEMDRGKIGLAADSSCPQLTEHPVADRTVRNSCRGKQLDGVDKPTALAIRDRWRELK